MQPNHYSKNKFYFQNKSMSFISQKILQLQAACGWLIREFDVKNGEFYYKMKDGKEINPFTLIQVNNNIENNDNNNDDDNDDDNNSIGETPKLKQICWRAPTLPKPPTTPPPPAAAALECNSDDNCDDRPPLPSSPPPTVSYFEIKFVFLFFLFKKKKMLKKVTKKYK